MSEPTLASIPGILLRSFLRLVARVILAAAACFLLLGVGFSFLSLIIATWRTPRSHRVQLMADLAGTVTALIKSFRE